VDVTEVEKQMVDRILDGATSLTKHTFSSVHIAISTSDYGTLGSRLNTLTSKIRDCLLPLGKLHLLNSPPGSTLPEELALLGFSVLTTTLSSSGVAIVAQKSALSYSLKTKLPTTTNDSGNGAIAISLPRREKPVPRKNSAKEALWTLVSPSTPSIDAEALLTPADRVRPPGCDPGSSSSTPRRKKACKGCTCGLAETEKAEEAEQAELSKRLKVVLLDADGAVEVDAVNGVDEERERLKKAAESATKATSSCGNCYLGDAFRCSSCPYKGLPAFNPGEKVQIGFGDDDL